MVRPDYYDSFRCIAGDCRHNCCIGWEIDIDDESLEKYKTIGGDLGAELQKNISLEPCTHFVLQRDERCPFLDGQNLCRLILQGGEEMLCQICREHPRFYNQPYGVCEAGIGISCEAAARQILLNPHPVSLLIDEHLPQNEFFAAREKIFALLKKRDLPLSRRIEEILNMVGAADPIILGDWLKIYRGLERLDKGWTTLLDSAKEINGELPSNLEIANEQLIHYFIYRHLSGGTEDFRFAERLQFAILSCYVINALTPAKSIDDLIETARMYSSEIEYSDENIEEILMKLEELNG